MTTAVVGFLAAAAGLGAWLLAAGLTGRVVLPRVDLTREGERFRSDRRLGRVAFAGLAGLVVAAATGWLAAGALAAAAVVAAPRLVGGKAEREAAVARTEAIATWTEMVRDSIAAASGLEEAIVATAPVAPAPIRREVHRLVARLEHQRPADALAAFGQDLAHPSGDFVVASLSIAAQMEASDLSELLSRLATSIRDDAAMRVRVEVGRTEVRTATKVILGMLGASIVLLAALNRDYLAVYDEPVGQLMLVVVGGIFAVGAWLLSRMATLELPERFAARPTGGRP